RSCGDEMLDRGGIAKLAVQADKAQQTDIRSEALASHEQHDTADLADEVFREVAEHDDLLGRAKRIHRLVDAVGAAVEATRDALLNIPHLPQVIAVAVLQLTAGGQ